MNEDACGIPPLNWVEKERETGSNTYTTVFFAGAEKGMVARGLAKRLYWKA